MHSLNAICASSNPTPWSPSCTSQITALCHLGLRCLEVNLSLLFGVTSQPWNNWNYWEKISSANVSCDKPKLAYSFNLCFCEINIISQNSITILWKCVNQSISAGSQNISTVESASQSTLSSYLPKAGITNLTDVPSCHIHQVFELNES